MRIHETERRRKNKTECEPTHNPTSVWDMDKENIVNETIGGYTDYIYIVR